MIDFNTAPTLDELFQQYGVASMTELRERFPELFADGEDEPEEEEAVGDRKDEHPGAGSAAGRGSASAAYVKTAEIKAAVEGREQEVLSAMGINWSGSRGHIDCPYADHGGKADWRWDEGKRRAFCSCIGTRPGEKKAHTIFDVVMAKEGLDFGAAKIRVAEIIGRPDLIVTKGGERRQKMDAASLLSPPAGNRDDALVWAYLGYRLGIDPQGVPCPSTPVAGLKALGYFDPPATRNGKPVLVATAPCAVFGQVDRDGGRHAHRIYLAPGGRGKANLGSRANGEERDPKKSARIVGEDSVAGRAVLWGNPETAKSIIIAEGIETAAAVALAFSPEIQADRFVVASCISAGGIEAFRPWPATKNVIVAADRDEGTKPDGRARDRRGERAARDFCLSQMRERGVRIALPGIAGEKVDWLDVLRRDGIAAVHEGIWAAAEFEPTRDELDSREQRGRQAAELDEIAATYPLPALHSLRLTYAHAADGKVMVHKVIGVGQDRDLVPIATPFGVPARLRHADQADAYGLRCLVQDMNDKPRSIDFDRALLARMGAADIRAMLFGAGLRTEADGDAVAVQLMKAADPGREIIVVGRPGWHQIAGCPDPIFVAPDGTILGAPDGVELELAASIRLAPDVARAGTLEDWRNAVTAAIRAENCPHWTLGAISGFAGPVVSLTGLDTCGINLSGRSTSGKTTGQRLAASSWSTPDIRRNGLMRSALTSTNAMEPLAYAATGTVLPLDELAHLGGKELTKAIYTIAGNTGKRRMTADISLRKSYTWSTFCVLSSEQSLEAKVVGDGGEWRAGMAARFPDIDVTGVNRNVDRETLRAIEGIECHYGHAGIAFVAALIHHGLHRQAPALREQVLKAAKVLAGDGESDAATARAARPLALLMIAGKMAVEFGLLPPETPVTEAVEWGWRQFRQSSDSSVLDPEEQAISHLQQWIAERWDVTVKPVETDRGVNNREAVAWYDHDAVYIPKARIREAAGNAVREREIGTALHRRGLIAKKEPDRYYTRWVPKIGKVDAYALNRKAFGRSAQTRDPDNVAAA